MIILWILLIGISMFLFLSETIARKSVVCEEFVEAKLIYRPNSYLYYIFVITLSLFAGLRSSIGDTGYYMYSFTLPYELVSTREIGFTIYQLFLKNIISHPQFLLLVSSFITLFLIMITFYRYSYKVSLSVFLFIASGLYVSTMNGLRQFLVAAVIFYFTYLITNSRKTVFFILVLFLSLFHVSVLIMIPVYFLVRQEPWSKKMILFLFVILSLYLGFDSIFEYFLIALQETSYGHYTQTFGTSNFEGAHPLRIVLAIVPIILSFFVSSKNRKKIKNFGIYLNFSILNAAVLLFSSYNWIFARLGIYFELYNYLLIPLVLVYGFRKYERFLITFFLIVSYIIFFCFTPQDYASYYLNISRELIGPLTWSFY